MTKTTKARYIGNAPYINPIAACGELKWFPFAGRWSIDYVVQQAEKVFVRGERILMNPRSSRSASYNVAIDMYAYLL